MNERLTFAAEPFELEPEFDGSNELFNDRREETEFDLEADGDPELGDGEDSFEGKFSEEAIDPEDFEEEAALERETRKRAPPGGGFFQRPQREIAPAIPDGGYFWREEELEIAPAACVPTPRILTSPAAVSRAVAFNVRSARSLGWGTLVDQIEVNLLRCPRAGGPSPAADFAQAVAQFQRTQRIKVDGMLGPQTWTTMKTIRAERDPFPRARLTQDFNATPNTALCELHQHPAIDIDVAAGTPIPVVADGLVVFAGDVGTLATCTVAVGCLTGTSTSAACNTLSYGRAVMVEHANRGPGRQPRGLSVYTIYAHVQFSRRHRVTTGERVAAGRLIAEIGADCVGFSSGTHLHYAVVTGPRLQRLGRGPSRPQICGTFWPAVTPRRPRTTTAAAFTW